MFQDSSDGHQALIACRPAAKPKVVLAVADEHTVARDLQVRLTALGFEVPVLAASKEEALEFAERERPDLVLMDISLHGTPEAAREIRLRLDIPIVYLTAHSDFETLDHAKLAESFGYVLRPLQDRELLVTIEAAIDRHQAERQLAETRRWLAATLSSIADAVITTGVDGRVRFMNRVAEDLTGWTCDDASGKDLLEIFHFVDPETGSDFDARDVVRRVLQDGLVSALKDHTILVAKHGERTAVADSIAPIRGEHGQPEGLVLVFRDVTERELARLEIRQRNVELEREIAERKRDETVLQGALATEEKERRLLEAVFAAQTDGVFVCDAEGVVLLTNPAGATCFGFDPSGLRLPEFVDGLGIAGGLSASVTQRALRGETILRSEQAAGNRFLETSSAPMVDSGGHVLGAVTITRDITERKLLEERLREAHKMESVGHLAGGVAHDFNNLLSVIMGNAGLGLEECGKCQSMDGIIEASNRAADLTKQLLAYAGKGQFVSDVVDLSDLISESSPLCRSAVPKKTRFELQLAEDLLLLEADPNLMRQLVSLRISFGPVWASDLAHLR